MPPKTEATAKTQPESATKHESKAETENQPHKNAAATSKTTKKRKQATSSDAPQKAARRSGRVAPKSQPSQKQLLNFLVSKEAEDLCRPDEERADIKSRGNITTYSSVMNPFEELLCAVILSRPISHRLGLRSIRTILNDPYNFTSAKAVKNAGPKQHLQAFWDARTQHKDKTAEQIGQIADIVLENFTAAGDKDGTQLQRVLDDNYGDVDKALDELKSSIKGLGPTGVNIFLRRVQWCDSWTSGYPYVDDRTQLSLRKLGLPVNAEDLVKAIDQHWSRLEEKSLAGNNEAAKKRRAFVTVLERAIGADLEGKTDALLEAAGTKA
jgi:hypothetical protein